MNYHSFDESSQTMFFATPLGKKGEGAGDMVMVLWFFLLLVLLAGGIALGLRVFFGTEHDIREAEAAVLGERVRACIEAKGAFWEQEGFSVCGLSALVLDDVANTKLGVLVCQGSCSSGQRLLQKGSNFEACDFIGKNTAYARCSKNKAKYKSTEYEIVTSSNHAVRGQNI
jgi:hypothetical protein